jgi:hypothetical protein
VRADLCLPGSADQRIAGCARWKQFSLGAQALRFLGKSFFKGYSLFGTETLHDTTSCLRVLTAGLHSDPNMPSVGDLFRSEQFKPGHWARHRSSVNPEGQEFNDEEAAN